MNRATWIALYLLGLVDLAVRYRLGGGLATWVLLAPVVAMVFPLRPKGAWGRILRCGGAVVAGLAAIALGRCLGADPWDLTRLDLAMASAALGLGSLLTVEEALPSQLGWPVVLGWFLAGTLPLGPWFALAAWSLVAGWGEDEAVDPAPGVAPALPLLFMGLLLPKPLWDTGAGAQGPWGVAWMGLGAMAAAHLPRLLPPTLGLGLAFLLHPWLPAPLAGLLAGVTLGWAWAALPRPWPRGAQVILLFGMLLSYALHANLQVPGFGLLLQGAR